MLIGDCLSILPTLPAASVDLVLADPPYGITRNAWDCSIDLQRLWPELRRVAKPAAAIVLCAAPPFDKHLAVSNVDEYRYDWVWEKGNATGHLNAKRQPLRAHEYLLVFYRERPTYNPQKTTGHRPVNAFYTRHSGDNYGPASSMTSGGGSTERYPRSVLRFKSDKQRDHRHSTQKPLDLMRYMVRTYSNPGDVVLDFCAGSGTTGRACTAEGRGFIGIELSGDMREVCDAWAKA